MGKSTAKPVIGILGGIGAGKSTVAAALGRLGCQVIDGDAVGHEILERHDVRQEIRAALGADVLGGDGSVDRKKLGGVVFADAVALKRLNAIMHPRIRRRLEEMIARARADEQAAAAVLDAAIMIEAGWDDLCTALVFVEAEPAVRRDRAARARGWDPAMWRRREDSQISLDRKRSMCQYTVYNCSDVVDLEQQVREVFTRITHAKGPS